MQTYAWNALYQLEYTVRHLTVQLHKVRDLDREHCHMITGIYFNVDCILHIAYYVRKMLKMII